MALIDLKLKTFSGMLLSIPRNLSEHFRNLLEHSPESLIEFPGAFDSIPRNFLKDSHREKASSNKTPESLEK